MSPRPAVQGARGRRRWPWWVAVLLLGTPVVEIVVLIAVARWIGVLPTVLLLAAETVLGGWLVLREAPRTWRALREALGLGTVQVDGARVASAPARVPGRELADGALVLIGGALLLLPGFVTDLLALVCLVPFTRPLPRRLLMAVIARRTATLAARVRGHRTGPVPGQVVEGTVLERKPPTPPADPGAG